ncbi:hypothetical protein VVD49_17530 [Uliginosibacterium sp. H3]|uniref:Lipoprotein n=1 Tax=Uliginosibacterium silvisoli TaxID=3114758 RepID=A0ABU6K7C7_9RHOO|nr:hypothetical protein [Uliginosibacterium sp. H3]
MRYSFQETALIILSALLIASCSSPKPIVARPLSEATSVEIALRSASSVFVTSFGTTDAAARFSLLLKQELSDQGFTTANDPKDADLVLTGVFEQGWANGRSQALATVSGASRSGSRIWSGDFPPLVFIYPTNDPTKRLVVSIVNQLREDVDELQKRYK